MDNALRSPVIDCHAHIIPHPGRDGGDLEHVLARCDLNGVEAVVFSLACEAEPEIDLGQIRRIAAPHRVRVRVSIGQPPPDNLEKSATWANDRARAIETVRRLAKDESVVAVGEVGLDYHWPIFHLLSRIRKKNDIEALMKERYEDCMREPEIRRCLEEQRRGFVLWAELAAQLDLPLVIHTRDVRGRDDAVAEAFAVLDESSVPPTRVMFHCFASSVEYVRKALQKGYRVSVPSSVVYRENFREIAAALQMSHMLLETDSPYHCPIEGMWKEIRRACRREAEEAGMTGARREAWVDSESLRKFSERMDREFAHLLFEVRHPEPKTLPAREYFLNAKKRLHNEPTFVRCAAGAVAEIKNREEREVCEITTANAREFYGLR